MITRAEVRTLLLDMLILITLAAVPLIIVIYQQVQIQGLRYDLRTQTETLDQQTVLSTRIAESLKKEHEIFRQVMLRRDRYFWVIGMKLGIPEAELRKIQMDQMENSSVP